MINPALQLQNAPQTSKHSTEAQTNHWDTDHIAEQATLPRRIERLIAAGDWASNDTTLDNNNTTWHNWIDCL